MKSRPKLLGWDYFLWLTFLFFGPAHAGEHYAEKDEFDGTVFQVYKTTRAETDKHFVEMFLYEYNPSTKTVEMIARPSHAYLRGLECKNRGIEIKTSSGVIHTVDAWEGDEICGATLKTEWIEKVFSVRIPTSRGSPAIVTMNTRTLKLERLVKR